MTDQRRRTLSVAQRSFESVLRNRTLVVVAVGYALSIVGFAWVSSGGGYLALSLNLLTPLEVLVPLVAFAVGYHSILGDRTRGELAVFRTYPLSGRSYVLGVYLGRLAALLVAVLVPLVLASGVVVFFQEESVSVIASHETVDTPIVYVRLFVLTAAFAATALAVAIGVSALAGSRASGIALSMGAVLTLLVGLDFGLVAGLATDLIGAGTLEALLAVSPLSAFRGLVLELVVAPIAAEPIAGGVHPVWAMLGLAMWTIGPLAVASRFVFR
ncbi:ABC transporter permease subunit [Halorhabdus sp. CUG00001]|uniref:ABC transporter permease subunit n=1 Tax=Halorhabdus sp. CUG00001 TaxID=2600297 RepID=UPI00131D8CA8|nr:ABC transporter permease subunit [Halorhabdus sp. CUG00001]